MDYIYLLSMFFISSSSLMLALFLKTDVNKKLNLSWKLCMAATSLWSFGRGMMYLSQSETVAFMWMRISYCGSVWLAPLWTWISYELTDKKIQKKVFYSIVLLFSIFTISIFSPFFITKLIPKMNFRFYDDSPGILFNLWSMCFNICLIWYHIFIFKRLKNSSGILKNKIIYFILAGVLGFGGSATTFPLVNNINVYPFGVPIIAFFPFAVAYGAIKYHLMDINLFMRYGAANLFFIFLSGIPFGFLIWILTHSLPAALISFFSPIIGHYLIDLRKEAVYRIVDSFSMFKQYEGKNKKVKEIQNKLIKTQNLNDCYKVLVDELKDLFSVNLIGVFIYDSKRDYYIIKTCSGDFSDPIKCAYAIIKNKNALAKDFQENKKMIFRDLLISNGNEKNKSMLFDMNFIEAEIAFPVFLEEKLNIIVSLSKKKNGGIFNSFDLRNLIILLNAFEWQVNALNLEMKRSKMMASLAHDLMKPFKELGAFYTLQEIYNESFGSLIKEQKEKLMFVIKDLMFPKEYIPLLIHPEQLQKKMKEGLKTISLTEIYQSVQYRYKSILKDKNIDWIVSIPPKELKVVCNPLMLEERGILNLIDNAIRYTPNGGKIELGFMIENNFLKGFVFNSGKEISSELLKDIFESGKQGTEKNKGAAGLGLNNFRESVEIADGKVAVENVSGQGVIFYFYLKIEK